MNAVLVWVLVTFGGYGIVSYSPPHATKESCQFLQQQISNRAQGLCIGMYVEKESGK